MKAKIIIACLVIAGALVFGAVSFVETNIEYTDFHHAVASGRKVQVKGEWLKTRETAFDPVRNQFIFYMKDDEGDEEKVVLDGAKPNNFEIARAVVVKGHYHDGCFYASDILTKCPSKYEADAETVKKSL